jgi:anti-anti-sigma factor
MSQIQATFRVGSDSRGSDCVIEVCGDVGDDAEPRLRDILSAGLGELPTRLIIDLAGVTSLARPALSALAAARNHGRALGTDVVLRSPSESTVRQIDLAGLSDLLPVIYPQDDRAARPAPSGRDGSPTPPGDIDLR